MAKDDPTTTATKRPRPRRKAADTLPSNTPSMDAATVPASPMPATAPAPAAVPMETRAVFADDGAGPVPDRVEIRMTGVGRVEAAQVTVNQGAVGAVRADQLWVERGAVGAAMADRVEVSRGYARSILGRQVQLDRSAARVIIAADVRAERSAVMFLVARRVHGEMRVLFDWRGALAFGAAAGFVFAILARVRGRTR